MLDFALWSVKVLSLWKRALFGALARAVPFKDLTIVQSLEGSWIERALSANNSFQLLFMVSMVDSVTS